MTERERRKRRQALQKRIEGRTSKKQGEDGKKGLFLFRLYVTAVLCGAVILLSFFHTPTSERVIHYMKQAVSYQIPMEHIVEAREDIEAFLQKKNLPVPAFLEKQGKRKKEFVPEGSGMVSAPLLAVSWTPKTEPWQNPVDGVITSSCGKRQNPILKKEEFHDGLDIAAAEGTDATAVKSGVVTNIRQSDTLGLILEYETKDGFFIRYAHLQKVLVEKGEKIQQGQVVAKVGNTGRSTGPHLHYTVKKDGVLLDPMPFVDLEKTREVDAEYVAREKGEET